MRGYLYNHINPIILLYLIMTYIVLYIITLTVTQQFHLKNKSSIKLEKRHWWTGVRKVCISYITFPAYSNKNLLHLTVWHRALGLMVILLPWHVLWWFSMVSVLSKHQHVQQAASYPLTQLRQTSLQLRHRVHPALAILHHLREQQGEGAHTHLGVRSTQRPLQPTCLWWNESPSWRNEQLREKQRRH